MSDKPKQLIISKIRLITHTEISLGLTKKNFVNTITYFLIIIASNENFILFIKNIVNKKKIFVFPKR